ncbi:MAG TPA: xanthine dehydrogenase family protein subunit M [Gaiellaceae bacterium]|nr:xanthine dehydrogenase family protein subunit M [Gaiellaceae bacterium]
MYTMTPAAFDYHRPGSIEEALELLAADGETRALAGGHSLLPAMKLRVATPSALVDLGGIAGLDGIAREGDAVVIGALATHASVASSEVVREACPVLAEAAGMIGDRQVRNRGTIGGSIAHADPSADYPTVTTALGATIVTASRSGGRELTADECFVDVFTTALEPGELITSVRVPATPAGTGAAYLKHSHPASRYAVIGVAAVVGVEGGSCSRARVVVGGATAAPVAVPVDELVGSEPSAEAIGAAAAHVREAIGSPFGDTYASAEYRLHLAEVMTRRALSAAVARAG